MSINPKYGNISFGGSWLFNVANLLGNSMLIIIQKEFRFSNIFGLKVHLNEPHFLPRKSRATRIL